MELTCRDEEKGIRDIAPIKISRFKVHYRCKKHILVTDYNMRKITGNIPGVLLFIYFASWPSGQEM